MDTISSPSDRSALTPAGIVMLLVGVAATVFNVANEIVGEYQYSRQFGSYWSLAEKASTIPQKSKYVDAFVAALEAGGFAGEHNAVLLTTPDNSFDRNLEAVKSLQGRLHEILNMDVGSFQYQAAIQQITAQEQGEAKGMLDVFEGVWWKHSHPSLWRWVGGCQVVFFIVLAVGGVIAICVDRD
jgi:hypothetical protein